MSWLGDSFTSLTGHLSTLTKDVLSEGREEVGDYATELNVANQCIRDLEGQCGANKQELERMRKANTELEERCQAAELQINSISSQYRSLLQSKENEINQLKRLWQQHGEGEITPPPLPRTTGGPERGYGYHSDEADIVDLISSQQEINKLAADVRRLRSERDHWRLLAGQHTAPIPESAEDSETEDNSLNGHEKSKIQSSIEELEERLQDTIDEHQNQLIVLQDHYTSQLFQQQEHYQKEIALLNESLNRYRQNDNEIEGNKNEQGYKIQQKCMEDKRELEESKKEIEHMKLREKEKDRQLGLLTDQLEKLETEKLQLENSLEITQTMLSDLEVQLKEAKNKYDKQLFDKLLEEVTLETFGEKLTCQQTDDSDSSQTPTKIEAAQKRIEELEEEKEKVCNDSYATKLRLLAQLEAHHASTSEILEDIQAAQKRVNDETISSHIRLLHEKEDIVDHMQQANEKKLDLQNQLSFLQKSNLLLTSDLKKVIESLGNSDKEEFADIVESLNAEKGLLRAYNEDLYNCLMQLDGSSSKSYYGENYQDNSALNHSKEIAIGNSEQSKSIENSMQASVSFDDFDQMSLTSSMSELSVRNKELDIQVKGLQQQIETYEREIEHFEFVRADWQAERQAMEDLLLNLRAKLRMKEESLSVAMAEKGLIAVKKKYPEGTHLSLPPEESEDLDGDSMLEKVEQQIEELTQSNAQLENEKDVLWVERNSLLEEVSTLRNLNQALTVQLNEMTQNNVEEEDKSSSREELAFSLEETLAEKETEMLNLIHENQFLEESLDQLDQQHQEAMAEVLMLKDNLSKANKELQQEMYELKEAMMAKEEENNLLKTEVETMREQLTTVITVSGQKSSCTTSKAHLSSDNDVQPLADIDSVEDSAITNLSKRETMKSIVDAFHTINSDNVHLEEEILTIEERRKYLETQVDEMQQRNEKLVLENKKLLAELETLKKINNSSQLDDNKKNLKEDLVSPQFVLASQFEATNTDVEKYLTMISELQCKLASSERQIDNLIVQISMLRGEKEMLQKELSDLTIRNNEESSNLKSMISNLQYKCEAILEQKLSLQQENEQNKNDLEYQNAKLVASENEIKTLMEAIKDKQHNKGDVIKKDLEHSAQNNFENSPSTEKSNCNNRKFEFSEKLAIVNSNVAVKESYFDEKRLPMCDKQLQTAVQFDNTCNQNIQTTLSSMENELLLNDTENWKQKCADVESELLAFKKLANNSNLEENLEQNENFKDVASNNSTEHKIKRSKNVGVDSELNDNNTNRCDDVPNNDSKTIIELENTIREQKQEIETLKTSMSPVHQKAVDDVSIQDNVNKYRIMEEKVRQLEIEKEQMLSVMNEKSRECSNLKNEVHRLVNVVSAEKQALSKMQQDNQELLKQKEIPDQEMTKETVQNLCRLVRDKDLEIEALGWKNNTLLEVIQQSSPDTRYIEEILKEQEALMKQLGAYKSDREQIINALSQKHQESLNYHAEVQRLNSMLSTATCKLDMLQHHHESVSQQYEEKQKSLVNTQNEVISLKQRVSDLERQQMELEQKHSEIIESRKSSIMANITKEDLNSQLEKIEKLENLVKEKEKWIYEKDSLIHELSQDLQKQKDNLKQKENEINILQRQTENLVMHLKDTKDDLNVAKEEDHNAKQQLGNVQSEIALMKELNERLNMTVHEKEFEIKALQEKISTLMLMIQEESNKDDMQRILTESDAMQQKAQHFHHERDEALLALSQRQQEAEELKNEVQQLKDRENRLNNELERLREHLLQVEESYTKEALNAEEREKQLRNRLSKAEEHARISSTAVHNASQLANSQVESLQEQLVLIARQRDKALNQVSEYEDQVQQYSASLGNLQLVLEQFQKERERDIESIKRQHKVQLDKEKQKIQELIAEVWQKEEQLSEATEAIDAASRLSEQLDSKEEIIANLRKEVSSLTIALQKCQDDIRNLQTNTEGKVDRQVMKNLVLGYFGAPIGQKPDVIRLLARVLDFNQEEMSKAGVSIGREIVNERSSPSKKSGWISGWFGKADSQKAPSTRAKERTNEEGSKSFSALFVQFLQNESQPQHNISLPAEEMAREMTMKSTSTRPSRINPFNPLPQRSASVTPPSSPNKNTSYTNLEHPLIRPLSSSLPTFTPILVASDAGATTSNTFLQEVLK